jgi:rod shape-determining protein MreD
MRWFPFAILTLVATVLQTTVVPRVGIGGVGPDLLFLLAVHYALWGPWPDAGIAAWILGFIFGTQTDAPLGLHAFCYGAAAWGIVRMRQVVFREHPVTQFLISLAFTFLVQIAVWTLLHWLSTVRLGFGGVLGVCFVTAVYTAVCAPFVHAGLHRVGRWTGLRAVSRSAGNR